ncbi:TauD/TfdA dioxygenase family protein [Pseudomonas aeruginosa]
MSQSATARQPEPEVAEAFRITPLEAPLGAEVRGLDARRPLAPEQVLALKQALREHHILVFRQQHLDDEQYLRFATLFGSVFQPPADIPVLSSGGDGKVPDIVKVANTGDGELGNFALPAHIDHQWTPVPSSGSFLYALEVPSSGGETRFTNLARAYESLDEATRREIDGLRSTTTPSSACARAATAAVSPPTARRTSNRSRAASTHWYAPTRKAAGAYCSSAPTPRWRFPATTPRGARR